MIRVYPERRFAVAEYSGGMGLLRLTSPKTETEPFVDLMFRGVDYVDLPRELPPGLEVLEAGALDVAFVQSRLQERVAAARVFVIKAGGRRYRVVADELKTAESMGTLSESPFPPAHLTPGRAGDILP